MSLVLSVSASAFANDSSMPYIEVNDLTFKNADIGTKISFHGEDAKSLFNVLPNQDVYGYYHGFTATGKKKAVRIECRTHSWDDKKGDFFKLENGPACDIYVTEAFDPNSGEGDNSKWIADRAPQSVGKDAKATKKTPAKKK
jgi:hypothetical protein